MDWKVFYLFSKKLLLTIVRSVFSSINFPRNNNALISEFRMIIGELL